MTQTQETTWSGMDIDMRNNMSDHFMINVQTYLPKVACPTMQTKITILLQQFANGELNQRTFSKHVEHRDRAHVYHLLSMLCSAQQYNAILKRIEE